MELSDYNSFTKKIVFRQTERKFEKVFLENTYFLVTNVCQKLIKKTALKYNNEGEIS